MLSWPLAGFSWIMLSYDSSIFPFLCIYSEYEFLSHALGLRDPPSSFCFLSLFIAGCIAQSTSWLIIFYYPIALDHNQSFVYYLVSSKLRILNPSLSWLMLNCSFLLFCIDGEVCSKVNFFKFSFFLFEAFQRNLWSFWHICFFRYNSKCMCEHPSLIRSLIVHMLVLNLILTVWSLLQLSVESWLTLPLASSPFLSWLTDSKRTLTLCSV